jgi:hypothetical protein
MVLQLVFFGGKEEERWIRELREIVSDDLSRTSSYRNGSRQEGVTRGPGAGRSKPAENRG